VGVAGDAVAFATSLRFGASATTEAFAGADDEHTVLRGTRKLLGLREDERVHDECCAGEHLG
jgi:hypothetical protein